MQPISTAEFNQLTKLQSKSIQVKKLFGEASYREYYRLTTHDGQAYILMQIPAGKWSVSEEITHSNPPPTELPFLNIQRFLQQNELPVPQVLGVDQAKGWIVLQDLGDQSLESLIQNAAPEMIFFFYKQAIDLLVRLQKTSATPNADCQAFSRRFDFKLLFWEFEHFLEYGIEDRLQIKINPEDRKAMQTWGEKLCHEIEALPYGFTHRDFQSRNLMLHGYEFYLIDFQDALQGPIVYDLVALLRDSYVDLSIAMLEQLLQTYQLACEKSGLATLEDKIFKRNFYLVTLQRKLKDAGRFQFIKTMKGNDKFLKHVPTSLKYVKDAFGHLPEYEPLWKLIGKYLVEIVN
ncbi:MAG: phosphotransferase [Deltaproteobacteria bacterium]|nr:phosphotransferase [Deltaproteobacteria bacterium]